MAKPTQKITDALEVLNEAAREQADELGSLCARKYKDLHKAVGAVEHDVADSVRHGRERLAALRHAAADEVKSTAKTVDRKAHESPWVAMAPAVVAALAIGFLVGRKQ
jgi:ElaB/YqjD/DUF883 family membrane-anchored ribosome-binding protein